MAKGDTQFCQVLDAKLDRLRPDHGGRSVVINPRILSTNAVRSNRPGRRSEDTLVMIRQSLSTQPHYCRCATKWGVLSKPRLMSNVSCIPFVKRAVALGLVVFLNQAPLFGQTLPGYDISGGFSFLSEQDRETFPLVPFHHTYEGWAIQATGYPHNWFGIAGEVDGNYEVARVPPFTDVGHTSVYSFLVGPRFAARRSKTVRPFVEGLVGVTRVAVKLDTRSLIPNSDSQHHTTLQLGGGVDLAVRSNFELRVTADYRRLTRAENDLIRLYIGIMFPSFTR